MENWRVLTNFPGYEGSDEGRIRNIKTQRILKTHTDNRGYVRICLRKDNHQHTVKAARVLAETFLGERPGLDVSYRDFDRSNLDIENLEWRSRGELVRESFSRGERRLARATPLVCVETQRIYKSIRTCADDLECDESEICKCLAGKRPHVKGYHFKRI